MKDVSLLGDASYSAWFCRALLDSASGNEKNVLATFFFAFSSVYSPFVDTQVRRGAEKRQFNYPSGIIQCSRPALFSYAVHLYRALQAGQLIENADDHCVLLSNAFTAYLRKFTCFCF